MKSSKCSQCGFVGWSDQYCKACGAPFTGPYQQPDQAEGQQKSLAVAALILGIISFLSFGMLGVGAIIGIIVSVKAMKRVSREPWKYGGRSMAIAGLVLNITALTSVVPGLILVAIAVPNLRASARAANEGSAMATLRMVASAEAEYHDIFEKYGTLEELAAQNLIDSRLAAGTRNGYHFAVELTTGEANADGFAVVAVPITYGSSGRRSFFIDESFVMRASDNHGAPSTKMDKPLDTGSDYPRLSRPVDYRPHGVY